ncbi:kinesin-related protein 4-like [Nylanderia fulva]|uniref:kinesin-related protein 4-like n=1 Tax=Nylanderia fulva TaxID=613905 RepID=UPI0010FB30DE|nr:kinesin-related protein 4-like [Nylanderia fulva]
MEILNAKDVSEPLASLSTKCHENSILVSCNWQITNNKQFIDVITTASLQHPPAKINCEDVAFLDTCIALQSSNFDPCTLDIKVTSCQKIARIAIVSESNVLEIFKQYGEYETTIFAEFIDEYEDNTVYLGETMIQPPTTEASIKFIRTKNKSSTMWVYGIRLFLIDSIKEAKPSAFNPDIIQTFLSNRNSKMSPGAEMAMKVFGYYNKQEIVNKEQFCQNNLENLAPNSQYSECKNGIGRRDNEKECSNYEDNYEKSDSVECKSETERKDNEDCPNCEEDNKKLDMDIRSCTNSERESKEAKSSAFNYKDFIQTFLSNVNGNMSQEADMVMRMHRHYNNKQKINMNNEFYQGNLKTLASNSEYLEYKNKNGRENSEKECSNHENEHEKLNSFGSRTRNVEQANKKDYSNCSEDSKQSDIKTYIDNKFYDIENKLMERLNQIEVSTNQKLDAILERLEALKLK